jgi:acyl dehydratase
VAGRKIRVEELGSLAGQELGVSGWLAIPQDTIQAFAEVTGDRQWIHLDPQRARTESPFGSTVAHGFLTLALVSRLRAEVFEVEGPYRLAVNYGLNSVRFPAPVRAGSHVRARFLLQSAEALPDAFNVNLLVTVEVEDSSKPALVAEWLLRYYAAACP